MKLTEQIQDLEAEKLKQKLQETKDDDHIQSKHERNLSTPPASSTKSDLSKRVGNALFILKSKAKKRATLQEELYEKIKTKMEYNMLVEER